jgi:hypothetical protein
MTPKRSIDPAIVRNIHERAVKAALADLLVELMSSGEVIDVIERGLRAGDPPQIVEMITKSYLDERMHPDVKVLAYRRQP